MCSRFLSVVAAVIFAASAAMAAQQPIRVCADPDNLPYSNRAQQGFENRIAELLARDMHTRLEYVWQRMGRGFVREFIGKNKCDLVIGIPTAFKQMLTTRPYYRSTFVFVARRDRELPHSLNDPDLQRMKIGVQILEEEYTPPADALARRGMAANIVGFESTGDDAPSIVRAVARRQVDLAAVWGPLAGYYARQYRGTIRLAPIEPEVDPPSLPMTFEISMGVRKSNTQLRDRLQSFLDRRRPEIEHILRQYGVPQLAMATELRASR